MAKYTELLSEYLENGGELPAVFSEIENFEDLFIATYCDCEIGFETPILFQIKLEATANIVIPQYKKRIEALNAAELDLANPQKKHVKSGAIKYSGQDTHTFNTADHVRIESEMPFAGENNPEAITAKYTDKNFTDTDTIEKGTNETYDNVTDIDSGYTPAEAEAFYKALEDKVFIILQELLTEFKTLFMVIY